MKILFYSSINIDTTYHVSHIVKEGETLSCTSVTTGAGGKGANQSIAFARALGKQESSAKVFLAGKCGKDASFIIEKLNESGVDTGYITDSSFGSGKAVIQVDQNGKNSIIIYGGGNLDIQKKEIDRVLENFSENDLLCLNCEINNLPYIINRAYEKKMKIILNPSPINSVIEEIDFSKISSLIVNEVEVCELSEQSEPKAALEKLGSLYPEMEIIMTEGSLGATYCCKNQTFFVPALNVKAVDTTGAGDTFMGFFFASRVLGSSERASMEIATKAAALSVSRAGAMDSIPYREEL